jgi:hypothetical protein
MRRKAREIFDGQCSKKLNLESVRFHKHDD